MYRVQGTVLPDDRVVEVFVVDGRFTFTPVEGATTLAEDVVLLPGLVDVHAHLSLNSPTKSTDARERVRACARAHLDAGVLAVREPGSPDYAAGDLGSEELLPTVFTAGRFLAPPGAYFPGLAREVTADELPAAAQQELARSGGWVKLIGDSHNTGRLRQTYPDDALRETARLVHDGGGRIAIHCALPDTIAAAVSAGFDSLEHGSFLRPDQLPAVRSAGTAWVPTCSINQTWLEVVRSEGYSTERLRRFAEGMDGQADVLRAAVDAGVPVFAGTDAGVTEHGTLSHEIGLLLAAGIEPHVALGAGSWLARTWLGLPLIEEGAPADLVAYREDPRASLDTLQEPALVMLGGRIVGRS